ncbi:unnamed protein product, partial [Rhizophagus irregularis]
MEKILNWKLITHILEKIDEDLLIGICRTIENDVIFKENGDDGDDRKSGRNKDDGGDGNDNDDDEDEEKNDDEENNMVNDEE